MNTLYVIIILWSALLEISLYYKVFRSFTNERFGKKSCTKVAPKKAGAPAPAHHLNPSHIAFTSAVLAIRPLCIASQAHIIPSA